MTEINCKNCGTKVNGNFCTHCGQSVKVGKINLSSFLSELSESVFQVNKGLFYSLKELFLRPGHSIRAYLDGKRKNHFKPIAYAFTLSAIYFLLTQLVAHDTFLNDAIVGYSSASNGSEIELQQLAILEWFAKNYAYTMLMLLPLYSLASYVAFLGSGFNYLEHFILNAYITGQQAIFYSVAAISSLIVGSHDFWATTIFFVSISYAFLVFWQFFSAQSRWSVVFRFILTYMLNLILLLVALFIVFLVL